MASRVVVPKQHKVGRRKQRNEGDERVTRRRVLKDIGNLPSRTSRSQLLPKNEKVATQKSNYYKNVNNNLIGKDYKKEVDVIVISSDEEEEEEKEENCKIGRKPSNTHQNTTVDLSNELAKKPIDNMIVDNNNIDAADLNNELAGVEYIQDMYTFYKLTEDDGRVHDYMESRMEINPKMRDHLVDWLIDIQRRLKLMPESLYLAVNIVDRFLSLTSVLKEELQFVGVSSMLIACKYEEIWPPEIHELTRFVDISYNCNAYREKVPVMEKAILEKLEWYLTVPTPYVFLVRYIKASSGAADDDKEMENMAFFFGEVGLASYSIMIRYCPSMIGACAVYSARCTLGKTPLWTEALKYHTGYSEHQLMECSKAMVEFHSDARENKMRAVYRKYSIRPKRGGVALYPPATTLLLAPQECIR